LALKDQLRREELIRELEARADAYQRQADTQPYAVSELKSVYVAKARECRERARELRAGVVAKEHTEASKTISFKLGERVAR
jgi:hypothetical protein